MRGKRKQVNSTHKLSTKNQKQEFISTVGCVNNATEYTKLKVNCSTLALTSCVGFLKTVSKTQDVGGDFTVYMFRKLFYEKCSSPKTLPFFLVKEGGSKDFQEKIIHFLNRIARHEIGHCQTIR